MMLVRSALVLGVAVLFAGCATERVILLPDEDGGAGEIEVRSGASVTRLVRAMDGAVVGPMGGIDVATTSMESVGRDFEAALSAMPPAPRRYLLYFVEGTTTLMPRSTPVMEALQAAMASDPGADVDVIGHTDRVGSMSDNDRLASARAGFVRRMLLEHAAPGHVVRAVGRGEREPLVPTEDGVRESRNRRVEVTLR